MAEDSKMTNTGERGRNWIFIVYPESAPSDWFDEISKLGVPFVCSPLHDKDKNDKDEPKKPHWHLLLSFHGKQSPTQVGLIAKCLGTSVFQKCLDTRGTCRYFLHLDNPEKAQYSRADIRAGGGFDLESALKMTSSELEAMMSEIEQFVFDNEICEYADLVQSVKDEWKATVRHNTLHFGALVRSVRHRKGLG